MPDIDIPFNYDPIDNKETTTSYTVPAGKYCIMSATLTVNATGAVAETGLGGALNSNSTVSTTSTANSASVTLRLKAGEVVTKSELPANTSSSTITTNSGLVQSTGTSTARLLVNGTEVSEVNCGAYAMGFDSSTSSDVNLTASVSGNASVHWHIAEYNSIT